jgi:hypothetical protein
MEWEELYDYTLDDTDTNALFMLNTKGISFYLASGTYDVPEGKWGIGTCNCCNNTLIKEFVCGDSVMAKVWGKDYVKQYLVSLIEEL